MVRCVGVQLLGRRGGRDAVVEAGPAEAGYCTAEYAGGLSRVAGGLAGRGGLVINHVPPQGRKRGSVLPGGAFCTVEPAGFRVAGLLDGREGADMDIDGVNGPNRDSPTTGYRAIDSAGVVLWEAKSGVCGAAVGILDERGGNNAVVDGLVDLNASSPSPSTTVASRCDICCAERKCSSLSQSGLLPSHWWLMLTDLLLLLLSQL